MSTIGKTVLSTTRFPEAVKPAEFIAGQFAFGATSPNFSPNCAPQRLRWFLFAPLYSVENTCTPSVSIRLLTEGL
jgi:hypothetical protein